jgi:hypothetical protein
MALNGPRPSEEFYHMRSLAAASSERAHMIMSGVSQEELDTIFIETPKRLLTLQGD